MKSVATIASKIGSFMIGMTLIGGAANAQSYKPLLPITMRTQKVPLVDEALKAKYFVAKDRKKNFLEALGYLNRGSFAQQEDAAKTLKAMLPSLPRTAGIVARLALAKKLSIGSGAENEYRQHLTTATKLASGLNEENRQAVLAFALGVWQKAAGQNIDWNKPPLSLAGYRDLDSVYGITERGALADWREARTDLAISKYQRLAKALKAKEDVVTRIDGRILDMHAALYRKTGSFDRYEKALFSAYKKYAPDVVDESEGGKTAGFRKNVEQKYKVLLVNSVKSAKRVGDATKHRSAVIGLAKRYMSRIEGNHELIEADVAHLYHLNKNYTAAVNGYLKLAEKDKSRHRYLSLAANSQRELANWPVKAPWNGFAQGSRKARTKLMDIYDDLKTTDDKTTHWSEIAHNGLLQIALGNEQGAYQLWFDSMKRAPSNVMDAQFATGHMLTYYDRTKNWVGLEDVARMSQDRGLIARHPRIKLNVRDLLAKALLNGGREKIDEQQYTIAVKKLKEFTDIFVNHPRHGDGMFYLAFAYRGDGKHDESIGVLRNLGEKHPNSPLLAKAYLSGGEWALAMGEEEKTIFFYQSYLNRFGGNQEAPSVRDELVNLYLGRELYAEASDILKSQSRSKLVSKDQAIECARQYLNVEEKFGSNESALAASTYLAGFAGRDYPKAYAEALAYQARYYSMRKDTARLVRIEADLSKLDVNQYEVAESLGAARFYIAQQKDNFNDKDIFSLSLTDPTATLNAEYSAFLRLKEAFDKVCQGGDNSFCAPAMFSTARSADKLLDRIEDVNIAESLAEEEVNKFNKRKDEILDYLSDVSEKHDETALNKINEGNTSPDWTQQVLWQNSTDWNFDRVTGETGNGYIQFVPASKKAE